MKKADDGYQNVANFVLNGRDMANWSEAKAAPYITELMNKEAYRFMKNAFGYLLGSGVSGDYHEYGCFSARTFRMALTEAKKYRIDDMYFYAADSFEGLPEPTNAPAVEAWSKGAMAMSEKEFLDLIRQHGVNVDKIRTIKGFFSDSLTPALQRELLDKGRKIAILNVDCDLKEAAADVFRFVAPLVQEGTLVYLDDFFAGYHGKITAGTGGAFFEFAEEHGWKYEIFANVGFWGRAYIIYR